MGERQAMADQAQANWAFFRGKHSPYGPLLTYEECRAPMSEDDPRSDRRSHDVRHQASVNRAENGYVHLVRMSAPHLCVDFGCMLSQSQSHAGPCVECLCGRGHAVWECAETMAQPGGPEEAWRREAERRAGYHGAQVTSSKGTGRMRRVVVVDWEFSERCLDSDLDEAFAHLREAYGCVVQEAALPDPALVLNALACVGRLDEPIKEAERADLLELAAMILAGVPGADVYLNRWRTHLDAAVKDGGPRRRAYGILFG